MRILSITAGAAGMYCGSCLRDNALAAELLARGHDVTLLPIYTPTLTDEPNMSAPRVFFGGISVYLQQHVPFFRKLPAVFDRLWDSVPALRAASRRSISTDPRLLGEMTISMLKGQQGYQAKEFRKLIDWLKTEPPPDIIELPNSLLISLAQPLGAALDRPVCCTLQGEDLFLDALPERDRDDALALIRAQAPTVDLFLAVSDFYAARMSSRLEIARDRIRTIPLGIRLEGYTPRHDYRRAATIGYLGRIAPEKGLHLLADAYLRLRKKGALDGAQLAAAGYLAAEHRPYLTEIEGRFDKAGLTGEFTYRGAPERAGKIAFLQSLDVFSMPATYDEPKGLPVIEAMAAGVPVIQPRRGSFVEIVERTGGGILVAPDDADALGAAIQQVSEDPALAERLGGAGRTGVERQYTVKTMGDAALQAFEEAISKRADRRPHLQVL
jgi:glycosyltransferase involved in cell wall biosynthesis